MKKLSLQRLLPGILATALFLLASALTYAQVAINTTGAPPDTSAMLDVSSSDKGILIPRMDSTSRTAILQPDNGLTVYDTTTTTFWYYDNDQWNEIRNGSTKLTALDLLDSLPVPDQDQLCLELLADVNIGNLLRPKVRISGDYAFVATQFDDRLISVDISDRANPVVLSTLTLPVRDPIELEVRGNYAFVVVWDTRDIGTLFAIDISDPANMTIVDTETFFLPTSDVKITIEGNRLYVGLRSELLIFNISNPNNVSLVPSAFFDLFEPLDIAVAENRAFLLLSTSDGPVLQIWNVGNTPRRLISTTDLTGSPVALAASANEVYLLDDAANELKIFDVSNPNNLTVVGSFPVGNSPTAIKLIDQIAYVVDGAAGSSLLAIDVSDATNPSLVDAVRVNASQDLDVEGNTAVTVGPRLRVVSLFGSCPLPTLPTLSLGVDPNSGAFIVSEETSIDSFALNGSALELSVSSNPTIESVDLSPLFDTIDAGDDLGDHTATTNLNLSDFNLTNGGVLNAAQAKLGDISLGAESDDQNTSNQAGNGFITTPWMYTNAVEAQGERGPASTLVTIGNDGAYGSDDEIHLVTNGESALMVANNGEIGVGTDDPQATLDLHGADDNTKGRIIVRRGSRNSYLALAGPGNAPYHSAVEVAQFSTGTTTTAIAISNENDGSFGYVGVGRVPMTYRLEVEGQASKTFPGSWSGN
ncbi:MAG: hypothetical protein AAF840_10470, partial [Bacteroidota bacterium]